jgi:uncharacterized protein YdaU (DUF1376 family)
MQRHGRERSAERHGIYKESLVGIAVWRSEKAFPGADIWPGFQQVVRSYRDEWRKCQFSTGGDFSLQGTFGNIWVATLGMRRNRYH